MKVMKWNGEESKEELMRFLNVTFLGLMKIESETSVFIEDSNEETRILKQGQYLVLNEDGTHTILEEVK